MPAPSTLQSISWSPSKKRLIPALVPTFSTVDVPFTLRSFIRVTLSPSASKLPTLSLKMIASSSSAF
ncbi:MAG: hypothetical protein ACJAS9_002022 [Polaribacter sp.]|jgi:hypothetical protein